VKVDNTEHPTTKLLELNKILPLSSEPLEPRYNGCCFISRASYTVVGILDIQMKVKKNKHTQTHVPNRQHVVIYIIPYILPHMSPRGMYLKEKRKRNSRE
jgi:hypothetical protein